MAPPAGDAGSELLLSGIAEQLLAEYPENATALGLDTGARAVLKSQLNDRSPDGRRRLAAPAAGRLAPLKGGTEERPVGKGCVRTLSAGGSPEHQKTKTK